MQAPPQADWIDKGTRNRHNTQPMIALERVKMAAENANFRFSREAPQDEMRPGVHRRVLGTTERMMLTEFFLERGSEVPTHAHPHDQVGYVTAGRLALTVADDTQEVVHGDSYAIPGGVPIGPSRSPMSCWSKSLRRHGRISRAESGEKTPTCVQIALE